MRLSIVGLANLGLGLICTVGFSSAFQPSDCLGPIQNSTLSPSKYTNFCSATPYQLISISTANLVQVTSTFQELNDLPFMLRAAENFWDKGPLVDKKSLLAYLSMEYTTVLRVIFANFVHITDVALSRLENIATVDPDNFPIRLKLLLYCRESEFLQNYFRELQSNIDACKEQVIARIRHVRLLLRHLQIIKANRKFKLERLIFTAEYFSRAEEKLMSIIISLEIVEDKVLLKSGQETEVYWDCRSRINAGVVQGDKERKYLQWSVAVLKAELETLDKSTARWVKANSNEKGYFRGFAFSLQGL